jgi:prolyl oligopeptidase
MGRAWLEKGGVYVVANIRGGGEYGLRWHQAALKQNRHKAYEDMARWRATWSSARSPAPAPGAQGGSNGGLLTGNMLTQYPELFGAVVVQVPLLDMKRYSHLLAGASWMAVRQPGHQRLGIHQDLLAVPPVRREEELPAGAVHDLHPR